jgi:hypothetical protein
MGPCLVEEVKTIINVLYLKYFVIDTVLQEKLLEVVERSLMGNSLTDLHGCTPSVWCELLLTVLTLLIVLYEVTDK